MPVAGLSVDWPNRIITVSKAYMILIQPSPEIYQLDMDVFRLDLKDLEDDEGMAYPDTHSHNTTVTVSGAVLARVVQFINGYTVTFEDGQYRVNVVGANTNIGEVTNVNQVSVSTSNSAGLQDLNSLQAASFQGYVALKPSSIYSGTTFPVGTRAFPVNNLADCVAIATTRGLNKIWIMESMTLATETVPSGTVFEGDSPVAVLVTVDPSAQVAECEFRNVTVQGTLDGNNVFRECSVGDVDYVSGFISQCSLTGTITLGGGAQANIFDCFSGVAGGGPTQTPTIDMNGNEQNSLAVRSFAGGLKLINNTAPSGNISLDFESGRLIVESTISDGDIYVRGNADVTDNSTGTATVYDFTINADFIALEDLRKLMMNRYETDPSTGKLRVYDDDDVTILFEADGWEDVLATVPYQGRQIERRDRFQ